MWRPLFPDLAPPRGIWVFVVGNIVRDGIVWAIRFHFFLKVYATCRVFSPLLPAKCIRAPQRVSLMSNVTNSLPALTTTKRVSLNDIKEPVGAELKAFQRYFREAIRSRDRLLNRVIQYTLRRKGKQIRPLLVMLSAKICGTVNDVTFQGAALVELLHTATLVHDDVVDEAERRRGLFSINALWKNKIAVLFGDFLLSRGLLLALEHKSYDLLHVVSDAVRRMSEGELLQIEKSRKLDIDEPTYFRIISDKTASLLAACTACGAISVTQDAHLIERMREIGEKLGLAFQLKDDLFDYGLDDVGKPLGIDLKEKKLTLPLIYALRESSLDDRKRIMKIVRKRKKNRSDIRTVAQFAEEKGGLSYAQTKMEQIADEARHLLLQFPPTTARDAMMNLISFIIYRRM